MKDTKTTPRANTNTPNKKKKVISICVLIVGLIALIVGVFFLVLNIIKSNQAADGSYLVSVGEWRLEDGEGVVWNFTEVGKGKLTTNNHLNDYDFIWALNDGELKIETNWLYDLENTYKYEVNKSAKTLTLTDPDNKVYKFTAAR